MQTSLRSWFPDDNCKLFLYNYNLLTAFFIFNAQFQSRKFRDAFFQYAFRFCIHLGSLYMPSNLSLNGIWWAASVSGLFDPLWTAIPYLIMEEMHQNRAEILYSIFLLHGFRWGFSKSLKISTTIILQSQYSEFYLLSDLNPIYSFVLFHNTPVIQERCVFRTLIRWGFHVTFNCSIAVPKIDYIHITVVSTRFKLCTCRLKTTFQLFSSFIWSWSQYFVSEPIVSNGSIMGNTQTAPYSIMNGS